MPRTIVIKLTCAPLGIGPFDVYGNFNCANGVLIANSITRDVLISGYTVVIGDDITTITIKPLVGTNCFGQCLSQITIPITFVYDGGYPPTPTGNCGTSSLWRHLDNPEIYNTYYGEVHPYIIEYPFAYKYQDEIVQNIQDYTKSFRYLQPIVGVWDYNRKVECDEGWFNKAVLYNGQQSSGILELVPKPKNDMQAYMGFPVYTGESKVITYTKSDNFYQYNTFWGLVKDKCTPLFVTDCCYALSLDKSVNQENMDYSKRSFKKEPLRAKDLKVRHILDDSCTTHLVSQFIVAPSQISYK